MKVRVRMYRQGLGDSFLITFDLPLTAKLLRSGPPVRVRVAELLLTVKELFPSPPLRVVTEELPLMTKVSDPL